MTFRPDPRNPASAVNRVRETWRTIAPLNPDYFNGALLAAARMAASALDVGTMPNALGNPMGLADPAPEDVRIAFAHGFGPRSFAWDGLALNFRAANQLAMAWARNVAATVGIGGPGASAQVLWETARDIDEGAYAGLQGAAAGLIRDALTGEPAEGMLDAILAVAFMRKQTRDLGVFRASGLTPGLLAASDGDRIFTMSVALPAQPRPARRARRTVAA